MQKSDCARAVVLFSVAAMDRLLRCLCVAAVTFLLVVHTDAVRVNNQKKKGECKPKRLTAGLLRED